MAGSLEARQVRKEWKSIAGRRTTDFPGGNAKSMIWRKRTLLEGQAVPAAFEEDMDFVALQHKVCFCMTAMQFVHDCKLENAD